MIASDEDYASALAVKWRAEYFSAPGLGSALSVPRLWLAWLLMDKAGVPLALIAELWKMPPARISKRIAAARALMIFPPFATRIECAMQTMPRFQAREVSCAS